MKFLVDNQLPPALARFIEADLGCECLHVSDVGLREASDREIWQYTSDNGLVLISKDEDFVDVFLEARSACLVWVRIGNCRRSYLLTAFEKLWPRVLDRLDKGDRLIELRADP